MAPFFRTFKEAFPDWRLFLLSLVLGLGAFWLASTYGWESRDSGRESYLYLLSAQAETLGTILALVFTAMPTDLDTDARGMAPYLEGEPPTGGGIRNFPYSTDLAVSPLTYGDIAGLNWPHGVGEVWAASLWEMYWKLVDQDGFDSDLYAGTGGNNLALQLVIDGMKLQPCSPTFVSGSRCRCEGGRRSVCRTARQDRCDQSI